MIYSYAGEIMDCDFLTGQKYNEEFVQNFYNEIQQMKKYNHIAGLNEEIYHIPRFRHRTRHNLPEIDMAMDSDNEIIGARNLTYQPIHNQNDIPKDVLRFMNFNKMKTECDAYHKQMMQHVNDLDSESDDVVQSATEHLDRYDCCCLLFFAFALISNLRNIPHTSPWMRIVCMTLRN